MKGAELSFEKNLGVEQWVYTVGSVDARRNFTAQVVLMLNKNVNKADWSSPREYGSVIDANPASNSFRLNTSKGNLTFTVDDKTHFPSKVKSLNDLKPGMEVFLGYKKQADGTLLAKSIIAFP